LIKNLAKNPNFEVRFQLLRVGIDKVYEIIQKNRELLEKEDSKKITESKMTIIENTCLLMDFVVNFSFDKMIYTVFSKLKNTHYLGDFIWAMKFTENYVDLLDELSTKQFQWVKEHMSSIMNELQLPDYPYENSVRDFLPTTEKIKDYEKKKKERLKLKKGPQLTDKFEL
jgi:ERK and JNK pathways, inhibitor